jgi:hypothetical protein
MPVIRLRRRPGGGGGDVSDGLAFHAGVVGVLSEAMVVLSTPRVAAMPMIQSLRSSSDHD